MTTSKESEFERERIRDHERIMKAITSATIERVIWATLVLVFGLLAAFFASGCVDVESMYEGEAMPYTCDLPSCCSEVWDVATNNDTKKALACIDAGECSEETEELFECVEGLDRALVRAAVLDAHISYQDSE